MVAAILHQLTRNLSEEEIKNSPFATYFVDHTTGVYPIAASGVPFDMKYVGVKGDVLADLHEDLAAEQKARVTYDNILRLCDDPDVREPSSSCGSGRSCITSGSGMPSASPRITSTAKTSTPATPPLIRGAGR